MRMNTRFAAVSAGVLGAGLLLTGCSTAQQAIDGAQSVISTAQVLSQACSEASVAWSPDATAAEATAGLQRAVGSVDEALALDPSLPGAATLLTQLQSALTELEGSQQGAATAVSTAALETACSLVGG